MSRFLSRSLALCLLLLSVQGWALSGPETAAQLNQRLAATPAQCVGGKPPYACSGVLMLPMAADHPRPFWHHTSEAQARGSERFLFLRRDSDVPAPGATGYILHDHYTAIGQGKPYQVVTEDAATPGEVHVRNWAEDAPQALAVQALYYDSTRPDSLLRAQRGQRDWFEATGQWLPLVRYAPGEGHGVFGFSQQEQLYNGYQVAQRLNARYANTAPCSDGRSGYYCTGVFVRTVDLGNYDFRIWNPSPNSVRINGVSFSYLRQDVPGVTWLVYSKGYVIRELSAPASTPLALGCMYPEDGATAVATDGGACTYLHTCAQLGITTLDAWRARYASQDMHRKSCSLGTSPADFDLMRAIRANVPRLDQWNEAMMLAWPQDRGEGLPIEAFVHSDISIYEHSGLVDAQYIQRDFLNHTGRYLPLLKIDLNAADGRLFTYTPAEQSGP
ncbi:hypothetical protein ACIP1T_18305 [Pseudomonas japonica]|uniref:hypothetical protein n=1 Tax=Pseudomonas japonica TaxID=256466 RepID=UPI00382EE201